MRIEKGGHAFPCRGMNDGMTLRDWFAGQALIGLAGQGKTFLAVIRNQAAERGVTCEVITAEMAYELADAMIAERD